MNDRSIQTPTLALLSLATLLLLLLLLAPLAPAGEPIWMASLDVDNDRATDAVVDGHGNLIVGGRVDRGTYGGSEGVVARYNPAGTLAWTAALGSSRATTVNGLAVDRSGDVYASVYMYVERWSSRYGTEYDYGTSIFKLDGKDGSVLWEADLDLGRGVDAFRIAHLDREGILHVVGTTREHKYARTKSLLLRFDGEGLEATPPLDLPGTVGRIAFDESGDFYLGSGGYYGASVSRHRAIDGSRVWTSARVSHGTRTFHTVVAILPDGDGGLQVAINVDDFGYVSRSRNHHWIAMGLDALTGSTTHTLPHVTDPSPDVVHSYQHRDLLTGAVIGRHGALVLSGYATNGRNTDWLTVATEASTGDTRWTHRFAGEADRFDYPHDLAADGVDVLVLGRAQTIDQVGGYSRVAQRILVLRLDLSTGAERDRIVIDEAPTVHPGRMVVLDGRSYVTATRFAGRIGDILSIRIGGR